MIIPKRSLIVPSRRVFLMGVAGATGTFLMPSRRLEACQTVAAASTAYPGQSGNPVGYAAAPGYPGRLTSSSGLTITSGASSSSPNVYSFYDFVGNGTGAALSVGQSNVKFVGCRFQSNATGESNGGANVSVSGANVTFSYCTICPLVSLAPSIPGAAWPAAGRGITSNSTAQISGTNCVSGTSGYQYGINIESGGPITMDHCDFWGFGNGGPIFYSTTEQMIVNACWIHDACNASPYGYHTDGTGYINGGTAPTNVSLTNNTIASLGIVNAIAFQAGTGYNNIVVNGNYVSGYGYCVCLSTARNMTNTTFSNNVFGTDLQWYYGPIYGNYTTMFSGNGNTWSNNKFNVAAGTEYCASCGAEWVWSASQNGLYMWPDATLHATDFVG